MKFKSQPNLFVRITSKLHQRVTGKKHFTFDENGVFETDNENLIKLVSQHYEIVPEVVEKEIVEEVPEVVEEVEEVIEEKKPIKRGNK